MCKSNKERGSCGVVNFQNKHKKDKKKIKLKRGQTMKTYFQQEVVVIATAWDEFKNLNYTNKILVDLRYVT